MSLVADINAVNLYTISYCRPTRNPRKPVSQLNGSANMSWKKKVCLRHLRKKIVCFCSGRKKKFCFLDGRKKIIWLGRKTIPPLPVLNGPPLRHMLETKMFLPHPRVKVSIVGSLRDRKVACSASDRQGSNFESCVWRTVSSQSSHHPQEVLLAQFSLYVHKGGLKPDSFHFFLDTC